MLTRVVAGAILWATLVWPASLCAQQVENVLRPRAKPAALHRQTSAGRVARPPEPFVEPEFESDVVESWDAEPAEPSCEASGFETCDDDYCDDPRCYHASPLEQWWRERMARFGVRHVDPNDPERHWGVGEPLIGTSWRNRPWYVSGFAGGLVADELQAGLIDQGGGFFAGARLGGDFDHYWGLESRLAFSNTDLDYTGFTFSGQSRNTFFDVNLLYYPLGDTRWRPYFNVGFGLGSFQYDDPLGQRLRATAIGIPFGGGVKYLIDRRWALRFDVTDNFTWDSGSHVDAMHNISFTGGVEFHFGGKQVSYGPW